MLQQLKFLFLFISCFCGTQTALLAQTNCGIPQAEFDLNANNIQARINTFGDLFTDGDEAYFKYKPAPNLAATIFTASLWMGGQDSMGNIRLSATVYRGSKTEYSAGPLPIDGTAPSVNSCANWDKVFSTTKERVLAFKANLAVFQNDLQAAIAQYPDIMGWPGTGNPHFTAVNSFSLPENVGLAPFFDADAVYNPLSGDHPAVVLQGKSPFLPAQIVWCVFNDAGAPHQLSGGLSNQMEVQLTSWQFGLENAAPFTNTVFTSHKLIYRGLENLENFRVGIFTDFDLGCYLDDYIGCNPDKNYFFAYNQDAIDGNIGTECQGTPTFGTETPVQSATFLNKNMDNFIYMNNPSVANAPPATTDPTTVIEFLNYLSGLWRDGSPITEGGDGYNSGGPLTNHAFPYDPADPSAWTMCTANLSANDRRTVASTAIGLLQPGAVNELTMAWTLHPNIPGPCSVMGVEDDINDIQNAYDNGFEGLSPVRSVRDAQALVAVLPNPANNHILLTYNDINVSSIQCFDMQGRIVFAQHTPTAQQTQVDISAWPSGVYIARLTTDQGLLPVRFVRQ